MDGVSLDDLIDRVRRGGGEGHLDRFAAAVDLAVDLAERGDALVDHFVGEARRAGLSWTEIGGRLGVTKQAARKRFTDRVPAPLLRPHVRLRPRLQACLDRAQDLARGEDAAEVGTHYLLAGLLADGVAAAILDRVGVTTDAILVTGSRLFGPPPPASPGRPATLSAEAVCAIEAAAHRAQGTAPDPDRVEVGTEHLLFVLALDPGGRARRVLRELGTDIGAIKKELACYVTAKTRRGRRLGRRSRATSVCSFCGGAESTARPLVHGPAVSICGTCVALAEQILGQRGG